MNFIIRECWISDAEAIHSLNIQEMGYDYPLEATRNNLQELLAGEKDKIFVAVVDGRVVGYIHANDYNLIYASHMKNILGIAVSKACVKHGIGRALLTAVEEWAKETGASGIRLTSGKSRTGAHEFYRHCGFHGEKEQLNFIKHFGEIT